MEEPNVCTDAGDCGSTANPASPTRGITAPGAVGEEVSLHDFSVQKQCHQVKNIMPGNVDLELNDRSGTDDRSGTGGDKSGVCGGCDLSVSESGKNKENGAFQEQLGLEGHNHKVLEKTDSTVDSPLRDAGLPSEVACLHVDELSLGARNGEGKEVGEIHPVLEPLEGDCLRLDDVLHLDDLHDDVLLAIACHLDARDIHFGLGRVCQRFADMFDNDAYWRSRIHAKCPKTYPALPAVEDFSWVEACVAREDSYRVWEDWAETTRHFLYGYNINGEVDVVHLLNNGQLLVTGDRNRVLNLVDLTKWSETSTGDEASTAEMEREMLVHSDSSHGGWVWSMASVGDTLITGSWDTNIRTFDVEAAGCRLSQTYKCSTAVLSLYAADHTVVAGCFKEMVVLDRRAPGLTAMAHHTMPVLCVVGDDRYVVTGSEDRTVCVHDRRAMDRLLLRHKLDTYPMCMSFHDNQLWFGDKLGQLHLLDGTNGAFNTVGTYPVHKDKLTGVVVTSGAIYTCSGDKTVQVCEPTLDPAAIARLDAVHSKQIAEIDFNCGVLASAGGDECVGVWMPREWGDPGSHCLL